MSFTRRLKYSNIVVSRKVKKDWLSPENVEAFGLAAVVAVVAYVLTLAI